jgi:hypothetical protein
VARRAKRDVVPRTPKNRRRLEKRRRQDGCGGKRRYTTREQAQAHAQELVVRTGNSCAYVYLCPVCSHLHVSRTKGSDWLVKVEKEDA